MTWSSKQLARSMVTRTQHIIKRQFWLWPIVAFDRTCVMISESRFEEALVLLGLLPDREEATSLLRLEIRDPGGNMTEGFRPSVRRAELPLTKW